MKILPPLLLSNSTIVTDGAAYLAEMCIRDSRNTNAHSCQSHCRTASSEDAVVSAGIG